MNDVLERVVTEELTKDGVIYTVMNKDVALFTLEFKEPKDIDELFKIIDAMVPEQPELPEEQKLIIESDKLRRMVSEVEVQQKLVDDLQTVVTLKYNRVRR